MKVSIITPTFNAAAYVRQTVDAILAQTYNDWELLITDDASTDDTCDIIEHYIARDDRIKLFRLTRNAGPAGARNHSIGQATGRYIAFCDSDDFWTPDKLEKQIAFMQNHRYAFTYAPYHIINEAGEHIETIWPRNELNYNDLLLTCDIGCLTVVFDTSIIGKVFMVPLWNKEDYALWLNILKKIDYAYCYPEPIGFYRLRSQSISSNKVRTLKYLWKMYYQVEKLPFFRSLCLVVTYSLHGIKKYWKLKFYIPSVL